MKDTYCTYQGSRDELIVSYLYGEIEPAARSMFESHLAGCAVCRAELAELGAVRADLTRWAPPEPARALTSRAAAGRFRMRAWTMLREIPAWAQVAAALLLLGVSARVANLHVRYDGDGVSVRTGWLAAPIDNGGAAVGPSAWQADLAALERQLRSELQSVRAAPVQLETPVEIDPEMLRRVRTLIDEAERRQRNELALRVAEVTRDMQAQRAADLQRIQYSLGVIENTTGVAMARQRQLLNNLAVRVSQR
jgi:anti-sigma factor RsiW